MTFKPLAILMLAPSLLVAPQTVAAESEENCALIEKSIIQGKAVATDSVVLVAVSAKDPKIFGTKYPTKTAKRSLQSMFYRYCGEFSGYKSFQVETRGGVSGTVTCKGKANYAYIVRKSNITIKELPGDSSDNSVEIPDIETKSDLFEEFK